VLAAEECAAEVLSSPMCQFTDSEHWRVIVLQREVAMARTAVNFVCRENVDGIYALS